MVHSVDIKVSIVFLYMSKYIEISSLIVKTENCCSDTYHINIIYQDQVLSSMQQKLDCLCEQLNNVKEHPGTVNLSMKNVESLCSEGFGSENTKFVDCGCWICDQHHDLFNSMAVRACSISK